MTGTYARSEMPGKVSKMDSLKLAWNAWAYAWSGMPEKISKMNYLRLLECLKLTLYLECTEKIRKCFI